MTANLINEFIEALEQEIKAVKSGKGGNVVKLFDGQFLRELAGLYIYLFHLENFLAILDDSPAEIEVNGMRYSVQVIMTQNLQVEIGIDRNLGKYLSEAKLYTNSWYLLELLKKKFIEILNNHTFSTFDIADKVFAGKFLESDISDMDCVKYTIGEKDPNPSQVKAIAASFYSRISMIWGPPGTGKTATIAKAVEAHVRAGRRVLLVSHANNAVDEALLDIAEQMRSTIFYNEGKLIRLGTPPDERLYERLSTEYPLVLLDNIAARLGASLSKERKVLQDKKAKLQPYLDQINTVISAYSEAERLKKLVSILEDSILECLGQLASLKSGLDRLLLAANNRRLKLSEAQSAGRVKRFFTGLDPHKIQREIDEVSIKIDSIERQINEKESLVERQQNDKETKRRKAHKARMEYQNLLKKLGIDNDQLENKRDSVSQELDIMQSRINEIEKLLSEIQAKILREAQFVATTLTKTFSSKEFSLIPFDVLILDEASMAPLPYLYWALGRCSKFVTIVGDFLQLPPICISEGEIAQKWLGRSIYDVLNIKRVREASRDPRINLLDIQYRMHPQISQIPKRFFYEHLIKDDENVKAKPEFDGVSKEPLVLIDTSAANPWCNKLPEGSRFNLYHALLSVSLVEKILKDDPSQKIGILAPYAPQARLIQKIAKDRNISNSLRISTIHRFQGGEESTILFDTVESPGLRIAPMLSESKKDSDARLILNVAFTRAKQRIYLIGHVNHLLSGLPSECTLRKILGHFLQHAETISSSNHLDYYLTSEFEKWAKTLLLSTARSFISSEGDLHTERNFYEHFFQDIINAKSHVIIVSPFLSVRRSAIFIEYFRSLLARGVKIQIFTKPIIEQSSELAEQASIVIEQLTNIGVTVIERYKIHNKTAIVDNEILWDGSLNILSHKDTNEHMWRFVGKWAIEEVLKNLELEGQQATGTLSDQICPECGRPMIFKKSRYGTFLSCSSFPKCRGKATIQKPRKPRKR